MGWKFVPLFLILSVDKTAGKLSGLRVDAYKIFYLSIISIHGPSSMMENFYQTSIQALCSRQVCCLLPIFLVRYVSLGKMIVIRAIGFKDSASHTTVSLKE